jgi:hypothetical protein
MLPCKSHMIYCDTNTQPHNLITGLAVNTSQLQNVAGSRRGQSRGKDSKDNYATIEEEATVSCEDTALVSSLNEYNGHDSSEGHGDAMGWALSVFDCCRYSALLGTLRGAEWLPCRRDDRAGASRPSCRDQLLDVGYSCRSRNSQDTARVITWNAAGVPAQPNIPAI